MGLHHFAPIIAAAGLFATTYGLVLAAFAIRAVTRRRIRASTSPEMNTIERLKNMSVKQGYAVVAAAAWLIFHGLYSLVTLIHQFGIWSAP